MPVHTGETPSLEQKLKQDEQNLVQTEAKNKKEKNNKVGDGLSQYKYICIIIYHLKYL